MSYDMEPNRNTSIDAPPAPCDLDLVTLTVDLSFNMLKMRNGAQGRLVVLKAVQWSRT